MAIGDVTRITSSDLKIEFQPAFYPNSLVTNPLTSIAAYNVLKNHVVTLNLNGATAGTFKLVVDGYKTADITASASLASTAIQTALEALPNVGTGGLVVAGSAGGPYTITAALALLNAFIVIETADVGLTTPLVPTGNTGPTIFITTQGSKWYTLDAEASSFSYTNTQESVDVTGISEDFRRHTPTVQDAKFDMTLYEALKDYRAILMPGIEGYLRIFEAGKGTGVGSGKRYFAWQVLILESGSKFEQFAKVEIMVSGRRNGIDLVRIGSHY